MKFNLIHARITMTHTRRHVLSFLLIYLFRFVEFFILNIILPKLIFNKTVSRASCQFPWRITICWRPPIGITFSKRPTMFEHKLVISPLKFAITSNTFFLTHLIVSEHSFVKLGCKNFYLSISTPIGSDKSRLYHHWRFCFSKANFIFHSNMVSTVLLNLVSKDFHFV